MRLHRYAQRHRRSGHAGRTTISVGPLLHLSTLTKIAALLLMTGWYSSSWRARSLESTNEGSGSGPSLLLYDKILQRRLFAPPAGHPCPASSDKTARPFYDRTARPRHLISKHAQIVGRLLSAYPSVAAMRSAYAKNF